MVDYGAQIANIDPPAALGTSNVTIRCFGSRPTVALVKIFAARDKPP